MAFSKLLIFLLFLQTCTYTALNQNAQDVSMEKESTFDEGATLEIKLPANHNDSNI